MEMTRIPVLDGWFTLGDEPALLGRLCRRCGTYAFPPTSHWCPNPACGFDELDTVELSKRGTIWSYTDARYEPPPPYVTTSEPYVPFAIAAVELATEQMIILGQVANGYGVEDLHVGSAVEIVLEPLETREGTEYLVWRWRPTAGRDSR